MQPIPFTDLAAMARDVWPAIGEEIVEAMLEARYVGGPAVEAFEGQFAAYCGAAHCVGVANGTDALLLTLEALGVGAGDEVLVPANTFIATAEAVVRAGATPRFVDVDPDTLLVTAEGLAAAITPRTRAAMVVHLYGQMPDMDAIAAVTEKAGIHLVEDAAQAHGATWRGQPVGRHAVAACYSFYPGKNLGAFGDGGAVVTDDAELALTVRAIANHGRHGGGAHYEHDLLGTNSRLDVVQAIALSGKLARLEEWTEARRRLAERYRERLADTAVRPVGVHPQARHVYHLFVVQVEDRDAVRTEIAKRGVQTGIHYPLPCHQQPPLRQYADGALPVSEAAAGRLVSLPMHPHLSLEEVDRVCDALLDVVGQLAEGGEGADGEGADGVPAGAGPGAPR